MYFPESEADGSDRLNQCGAVTNENVRGGRGTGHFDFLGKERRGSRGDGSRNIPWLPPRGGEGKFWASRDVFTQLRFAGGVRKGGFVGKASNGRRPGPRFEGGWLGGNIYE